MNHSTLYRRLKLGRIALKIGAKIMTGDGSRGCGRDVEEIVPINDENGAPLFYVTNYADGQGFVIVSAVKDYAPVLASSEEGRFDVENCGGCGSTIWLEAMKRAVAKADELPDSVKLRNRLEWSSLLDKRKPLEIDATSRSNDEWERMVSDAIWQWQNDGFYLAGGFNTPEGDFNYYNKSIINIAK